MSRLLSLNFPRKINLFNKLYIVKEKGTQSALRITTAMAYSSHHYQTQLASSVTVGVERLLLK
jgi:hypothetical protein